MAARAYVDTSVLVAILFRERARAAAWRALRSHGVKVTVGLTRAETMATLRREGRDPRDGDALLDRMHVFHPTRTWPTSATRCSNTAFCAARTCGTARRPSRSQGRADARA